MKKTKTLFIALSIIATTTFCAKKDKDGFYKGYEIPSYQVTEKFDDIELRQYAKALVAEVEVDGDRKDAAKEGFMTLARFIFGKNTANKKIAMTSPVSQELAKQDTAESQKISMTSPVTQINQGSKKWVVQFGMPKDFTAETLPKPKDERIRFKEIPERKAVAIIFNGTWSDERFSEARKKLEIFIKSKNIKTKGEAILAYYDDPFTFPWNRRNEVIWEIE